MTPRYAVYGLCALLAILAGLSGVDSCRRHQGAGNEHNAAVASGEANAHQNAAQAADPVIANLQAERVALKANLDRLSAERDALLKRLAAKPRPGADSVGDNSSPSDPVGHDCAALAERLDAADAVIAKDAEVIEAQSGLIAVQSGAIGALTISRDEWKATAEARERQALAQEAATKAWREAVTTSRWRGRVEGFAAGVALGYVARGQR